MASSSPSIQIGIDLGGTKIEIAAFSRDGQVRFRRRVPTPPDPYEDTVRAMAALVAEATSATGTSIGDGTASVGVGIPGSLSPASGLVRNANSTRLIGHALDDDLAAAIGGPVRLANDADCFALSEAVDGAAAGAGIVFGIILGTGVGGGVVVNGRLLSGPNAIAGEWGHNPLPWPQDDERPGPACYCGQHGCIETFLCGGGLSRDDAIRRGHTLVAPAIVDAATAGDPIAVVSLDRYIERLARATAAVINIIDPHIIVVGGGLGNIARLYTDVPRLWPRHVFSDTVATKLVSPMHGDASGVRGAAWLWP